MSNVQVLLGRQGFKQIRHDAKVHNVFLPEALPPYLIK